MFERRRRAELKTSGEVRVHLEHHCKDVMQRAQVLFHLIKMDNTKEENGILFYVAVADHQFAVIGDKGIHKKVGVEFWNSVRDVMAVRFRESAFQQGLIDGIDLVGRELAQYFPWDVNDINELPNEISVG
ncbi:TPM domain-containing protein [Nonlabens xiamenensis]|uniref:TPM domain-containing protein n=1 Tax=Nonlabens xiamenensis TaxID=2341043 RepID=UPI000F60B8A9|nr:TPM domain-containing protein [Nonlabens xiamenensis]